MQARTATLVCFTTSGRRRLIRMRVSVRRPLDVGVQPFGWLTASYPCVLACLLACFAQVDWTGTRTQQLLPVPGEPVQGRWGGNECFLFDQLGSRRCQDCDKEPEPCHSKSKVSKRLTKDAQRDSRGTVWHGVCLCRPARASRMRGWGVRGLSVHRCLVRTCLCCFRPRSHPGEDSSRQLDVVPFALFTVPYRMSQ